MALKSLPDEQMGKAKLRIAMDGQLYRGAVLRDGKLGKQFEDDDLDRLRHRLREEAGKSDPSYWGFDGAISRFLSFNPKGFADPNFVERERTYKVEASELLTSLLPLDKALEATADDCALLTKVVGKTNLLAHQHEQQHLRTILTGPTAPKFVQAAAQIAWDDVDAGLSAMVALVPARSPVDVKSTESAPVPSQRRISSRASRFDP